MQKMVPAERITTIERYYQRYGIITFIFGRFIPFGVRNALLMTAGLGKMNFAKFALTDWVACIISNSVLFSLTFYLGEEIIASKMGHAKVIIFALAAVVVGLIIWRVKRTAQRRP
jgi:membrane protein DedA with SNARE-associated domain